MCVSVCECVCGCGDNISNWYARNTTCNGGTGLCTVFSFLNWCNRNQSCGAVPENDEVHSVLVSVVVLVQRRLHDASELIQ